MSPDRFTPLFAASVLGLMGLVAAALVLVYAAAALVRRRGSSAAWAPLTLRILAVLGLVLPGWAILGWYRDLARARELTRSIAIDTGLVIERFLVNAVALLSLGFLLLVAGIFLARRVAR